MNPPYPTDPDGCPSWDTLLDFKLGQLPVDFRPALLDHLSGCSRCEQALSRLEGSAAERETVRLKKPTRIGEHAQTATTAAPDRWVGQVIGNCVVIGLIGRGGMGVVYRARQEPLGRVVALKMILGGPHASEQQLARFKTEGKAIARFHHPNVVQIYDFAEHDGLPYYTMELVEGGSLARRLRREALTPGEAARLVQTLALAVEEAHRKGVLHRDLKPGNILLAADGTPKIADFGLAKLLDGDDQTRSNVVLGTPPYMAPEQAEGRVSDIDTRTDVYALGAILYECLTGLPPFRGNGTLKTLEQVIKAEPVAPSRERPGLPVGLEHICLKCLEKEPARRYPSARALADDLGRWLRNEPLESTPTWGQRLRKGLKRHTALVALGLVMFTLVTVALSAPEPPLQRVRKKLERGQPVTLIGETGWPVLMSWQSGETTTKDSLTHDHTFTLHATGLTLLELLPAPLPGSYRFRAQVRHSRGDSDGEVGLYFGHQAYPGRQTPIHFFTRVTYNDVHLVGAVPRGVNRPPRPNVVQMFAQLHSEHDQIEPIDTRANVATGPRFQPAANESGVWRDLEVIVTPDKITAAWEKQPFAVLPKRIEDAIAHDLAGQRPRWGNDPFAQRLQPAFAVHGGLGLFVYQGSASFRAVTVTPLGGNP